MIGSIFDPLSMSESIAKLDQHSEHQQPGKDSLHRCNDRVTNIYWDPKRWGSHAVQSRTYRTFCCKIKLAIFTSIVEHRCRYYLVRAGGIVCIDSVVAYQVLNERIKPECEDGSDGAKGSKMSWPNQHTSTHKGQSTLTIPLVSTAELSRVTLSNLSRSLGRRSCSANHTHLSC